ncbi:hypothetical protein GCM10027275_19220 [Rhabdobacter roseus]|uniref:Phage holin family protein n=1 Tax=Rhabdobacter roseus TaxID=1655419 RepID=A0A840TUV8_9BACT|nr:phage holin family protein [Rhabdobacter roseus]MBB5283848.1 hypothetical protein [Rhabdobacter roseus]
MLFDDAKTKAEETLNHAVGYAEARWNLIALKLSDRTARAATAFVVGIVLGVLAIFFLLFISVSIALALGGLLNNVAVGFLIVALLYALIGIIIFSNRMKLLFFPIMNYLLATFYKDDDDKISG